MKSISLLTQLAQNPHYVMTDEERAYLENNSIPPEQSETVKKKQSAVIPKHGNAAVKEIGKLDKHASDPIAE